jgi:hypothetical protein
LIQPRGRALHFRTPLTHARANREHEGRHRSKIAMLAHIRVANLEMSVGHLLTKQGWPSPACQLHLSAIDQQLQILGRGLDTGRAATSPVVAQQSLVIALAGQVVVCSPDRHQVAG